MNKEVEKKLDELLEAISEDIKEKKEENKKNKELFKENRENIKEAVSDLIDKSEEVVWCVTDTGIAGTGTSRDMLTYIFMGLEQMVKDGKVPKELIRALTDALFEDEEEEDDSFFDKIKKFIEREI